MSRDAERMESLADRLDQIGDDIDELAFDMLREAAQKGQARPAHDKTLMQARRAITKAATLLRSTADSDGDD